MTSLYAIDLFAQWARQLTQPAALPARMERVPTAQLAAQVEEDRMRDGARLAVRFNAAREIRQKRLRAGLTQEALAERLDMTVPDLIALEIGDGDIVQTLQVCELMRSGEF